MKTTLIGQPLPLKIISIKYLKTFVFSADPTPPKYGYGIRHIQVLLVFSSLCINFVARAHLSVTIVAMADIPKKNNDIVSNNTIRENFTNFSEFGVKNASDNSYNVKNDTLQDPYKASTNVLVIKTGTLGAVNILNKSNSDIMLELTKENCTINNEMHNDTSLNLSIWNINRVSFKSDKLLCR